MKYKKLFALILTVFISYYFLLAIIFETRINNNHEVIIQNDKTLETFKKKNNIVNIIALVFYGRQSSVSILLKYLEKNLKSNGGILDKIVFAVRTDKIEDIRYLDKYLKNKSKNEYKRFKIRVNQKYSEAYKHLDDNDLVFKIDDDVVFISNGTFERMVEEYLKNDLLILSANVVNHPILTYIHTKIGAILPFIEIMNYTYSKTENSKEFHDIITEKKKNSYMLNHQVGAISHESFFAHYKNKNLKVYDFGLWDFHKFNYSRWSINFILFRGKYINKIHLSKLGSDEHIISIEIPKEHNKHAYALGSAIVSHFSYMKQYVYLSKTDILNKYKLISNYIE